MRSLELASLLNLATFAIQGLTRLMQPSFLLHLEISLIQCYHYSLARTILYLMVVLTLLIQMKFVAQRLQMLQTKTLILLRTVAASTSQVLMVSITSHSLQFANNYKLYRMTADKIY